MKTIAQDLPIRSTLLLATLRTPKRIKDQFPWRNTRLRSAKLINPTSECAQFPLPRWGNVFPIDLYRRGSEEFVLCRLNFIGDQNSNDGRIDSLLLKTVP